MFDDSVTRLLLVEDNSGEARLLREILNDQNASNARFGETSGSTIDLHVAGDGVEALAFLHQEGDHAGAPRPDLILLDLNLPRMDGREVLMHIREDDNLRTIPTVILTTSDARADILESYRLQANAYLIKPVRFDEFEALVKSISEFWLTRVQLPRH